MSNSDPGPADDPGQADDPGPRSDPGQVDLERATALCELGRHPEAVTLLGAVVSRDPQNPYAWCLLAQAQLGCRDEEAALRAAGNAAALAPDEAWPHRLASVALRGLGRPAESVRAAREAVRLAPHDWRVFVTLATALAQAKTGLAEARAAADHAVALEPTTAEPHLAVGAVAAAAGRREDAEAAFRRALALDPQNVVAHNELGRLNLHRSRFRAGALATSAEGFATAVRSDPRAQTSRRNLGLVFRVFLSRTAYLIYLAAFLVVIRIAGSGLGGRLLPVVVLAVPAVFAGRFVHGLSPDLRRALTRTIRAREQRIPAVLLVLAVVLVLATAILPQAARGIPAGAGAAAALCSRLWLSGHFRRGRPTRPRGPGPRNGSPRR